jgi:hypothetical protein
VCPFPTNVIPIDRGQREHDEKEIECIERPAQKTGDHRRPVALAAGGAYVFAAPTAVCVATPRYSPPFITM